ncbi:MAG: DHHA1 domain-containing protein [Candidatus Aenigmatarchaeota archaeon]
MDAKVLRLLRNFSKDVKNYLERFNKIKIFFDNDVDGLMSAIITYNSLKSLNKNISVKSLERDKLFEVISNLKNKNTLYFFLDLSVSEEIIKEIRVKNFKVIWIDHHRLNTFSTKGILYVNPQLVNQKLYIPTSALCYLIFDRIVSKTENLLFASIGIVADKGENDCKGILDKAKRVFKINYEKIQEYAKKINSIFILKKDVSKYFRKLLNPKYLESKELSKMLEKVEKEIEKELKNFEKNNEKINNFLIYSIRSKMKIRSTLASILSEKFEKNIIVIMEEKDNKIYISFRVGKGLDVDLLDILKKMKINFISFGGHKRACGAIIKKQDINKFLKELKKI